MRAVTIDTGCSDLRIELGVSSSALRKGDKRDCLPVAVIHASRLEFLPARGEKAINETEAMDETKAVEP